MSYIRITISEFLYPSKGNHICSVPHTSRAGSRLVDLWLLKKPRDFDRLKQEIVS